MKLLLTSAGIRNASIAKALASLLVKSSSEVKIGFVPTAANAEVGHKGWCIAQITDLLQLGYKYIDIVDPSAADVNWRERLGQVDVVMVSGGNTFHLLNQMRQTGFDKWLLENLERVVYVGISAGSIIATASSAIASVDNGDTNLPALNDLAGLKLVDFEISPHTPDDVSYEANAEYAKTTSNKLYLMDDKTALKVKDAEVEVVSEGEWRLLNKN